MYNFQQFTYIYTQARSPDGEDGFSLVKVGLTDGEEVGRAWVEQRKPKMELDPVEDLVFVRRTSRLIVALPFTGGI